MKRIIWLILICSLNMADFVLTVYGLRSGTCAETNPIALNPIVKITLVPFFAGITNLTAAQAEKEKSAKSQKLIRNCIYATTVWLAFIVLNNVMCLVFHCGFTNLLGI